jgi:hypothetical protein
MGKVGGESRGRHFEEDALERMRECMQRYPGAMALRRKTVEHPFANLKCRILGNGRFLLRGLSGAGAELALAVLAYNFRRPLNLLGTRVTGQPLKVQPA